MISDRCSETLCRQLQRHLDTCIHGNGNERSFAPIRAPIRGPKQKMAESNKYTQKDAREQSNADKYMRIDVHVLGTERKIKRGAEEKHEKTLIDNGN